MRRTAALAAAAGALAATVAVSGPSSKVAWTVETVRLVRSGNAAHGKKLHEDCAGCHGDNGVIDTPDVPNLAGQDALYTFKQLSDYKEGLRASPIMGEAVKPLSEKDMADPQTRKPIGRWPGGRTRFRRRQPRSFRLRASGTARG